MFRFALVWFSPFGRLVPSPRLASNLYKLDVALKFPRIEISSSLEISASLPVLCCYTRSPQYADVVTISGQPAINSSKKTLHHPEHGQTLLLQYESQNISMASGNQLFTKDGILQGLRTPNEHF